MDNVFVNILYECSDDLAIAPSLRLYLLSFYKTWR